MSASSDTRTMVAWRPRRISAARIHSTAASTAPTTAAVTMTMDRPPIAGNAFTIIQYAPPQRPCSTDQVLSATTAPRNAKLATKVMASAWRRTVCSTSGAIGSSAIAAHVPSSANPYAGATRLNPLSCSDRNVAGIKPPHRLTSASSSNAAGSSAKHAAPSRLHERGSSPLHCSASDAERPSGEPRMPAARIGAAKNTLV